MKKLSDMLFCGALVVLVPSVADAAGTYYTNSSYQNSRYGNNSGGYYSKYGAGRAYPTRTSQQMAQIQSTQQKTTQVKKTNTAAKQGFVLGIGASHEMADWKFDMNKAGSKLHYDNVAWNVIDGNAAYYFGGDVPMQIKVGARYGKQFDETSMIDDDISSEKMWGVEAITVGSATEYAAVGMPAMSVGTSKGGSQMGFNAEFGLTDFFNLGRVKMTPSLGYRYFKHKLSTQKNYGMMVQVFNSDSFVNCIEVQPGEIQCNPYIGFADANGQVFGAAGLALDASGNVIVPYIIYNDTGATQLDLGSTYYYEQSGKSHIYETSWAGPYLALDMDYMIDNNNSVTAGIEIGLPIYNSKGDQPYRIDWAHSTSVEDKGSLGDAYHLGLNADWTTAITDSVAFSLGFMYDFYKVSDGDATTYLNAGYYETLLAGGYISQAEYDALQAQGWKIEDKKEINSIYKSMGIHAGINIKF